MKKAILFSLITFCLINITLSAHAEFIKIPLYKLAPVKSVDLKCVSAQYSIGISLPQRWKIEKAVLTFNYVNSAALLSNKSWMAVKVNGYPIAQINLNPLTPEGSVKLSLPVHLLEQGSYTNITFDAIQHYTMDCEQYCSPDLWTTLRLDQASIEIEYSLMPVPLKLSTIPEFLFDPKIFPYGQVNIIMQDQSPEMVTLSSISASGIARRFDYRKVLFTVSNDIQPGYDNILIGNKDFVNKFLHGKGIADISINAPILKIMHLPTGSARVDPSHALLIVSGVNSDHTKLAAETLDIISIPYPDTDQLLVSGLSVPQINLNGGRLVITPGKKYTFKTLNLPTHTFKSIGAPPADIVFRLPADFLLKPNLFANLVLNFSYGAAFRSDSVLNIVLNGNQLLGIHLDNSNGGLIENYKIEIPTYLFKTGTNVIRFEAISTPLIYGKCENVQTGNLFLTLYEESTFYIPNMPSFTEMPRLELFVFNGFPITRWPDGHGAMIYLASKDSNSISAALNLVGMLVQNNGYPLSDLKIAYTIPKKFDGEVILIGDTASIPEDLKKLSPLKLTKESVVPYPVIRSWLDEAYLAFSKQESELSAGRAALMEIQSPYVTGRSIVMLTAASTKDARALSEVLLEPSVQANIKGDLNLINLIPVKEDYNVISFEIGKKYFSGKAGVFSKFDAFMFAYPWLYYAALVFVLVFLSAGLFYLLVKHRKKRLKKED